MSPAPTADDLMTMEAAPTNPDHTRPHTNPHQDIEVILGAMRHEGWTDQALAQARKFLKSHFRSQRVRKVPSSVAGSTPAVRNEVKRLKKKVNIYSCQHGATWYKIQAYANPAHIGVLGAVISLWGGQVPRSLEAAYEARGQKELVGRVKGKTGLGGYRVGGGGPHAQPDYCPTALMISRGRVPTAEFVSEPRELWELGYRFTLSDDGDGDMRNFAMAFVRPLKRQVKRRLKGASR
ncbi:uncharacterized protein PG986_008675 [Apiospora aurea]|uniref:Uncharacterized protein n=1 Tax=Apiospora aurea TaxID=335848 RepID=A0ABR1Q5Z2_9PEZI